MSRTLNADDGWGFDEGDKNSVTTRDPDGASLAGAIMQGADRTFLVPAVLAQVLPSGPEAIGLLGKLKTSCYDAAPMPMTLFGPRSSAFRTTSGARQ